MHAGPPRLQRTELIGLRKLVCFKVAFIAPREVSRVRVDRGFNIRHRTRVRLSSRGAMKATLVAAKGRAG